MTLAEGADLVMVKPALAAISTSCGGSRKLCLACRSQLITCRASAACHGSKAAAHRRLDRRAAGVVLETLGAFKRGKPGLDMILTHRCPTRWLRAGLKSRTITTRDTEAGRRIKTIESGRTHQRG